MTERIVSVLVMPWRFCALLGFWTFALPQLAVARD